MGQMRELDILAHQRDLHAAATTAATRAPIPVDPEAFAYQLQGLVRRYLEELVDAGVPDPLGESILLAAVVNDLFGLLGAPAPPAVRRIVG